MIVVDVGCHPQGPEESVHKLIDRFSPDVLFGFDPYPDLEEGIEWVNADPHSDPATPFGDHPTLVIRRRAAAWTCGGVVPLVLDGICTGVDVGGKARTPCFDLTAWLWTLPPGAVLKLDAEGAEGPLLRRVHELGLDERLSLVLVEWHPPETAHGWYVAPDDRPALRCPEEAW